MDAVEAGVVGNVDGRALNRVAGFTVNATVLVMHNNEKRVNKMRFMVLFGWGFLVRRKGNTIKPRAAENPRKIILNKFDVTNMLSSKCQSIHGNRSFCSVVAFREDTMCE